ncbi:MAG: restriction endonuclease [Bacteroidetes bacterium]|nr:restriction endonuclease [Bacteroidota bacterium]MBL6943448.1 restriction endonuclease [Bacteroidales bacterium]
MSSIKITKKSGEIVDFDINKLRESLIKSGASQNDTDYVTKIISNKIDNGISTHKLYQLAYGLLKKRSNKVAGRYRLKKAIFEMGPTGYPFESLVSELLRLKGYVTKKGQIMDGICVKHEVDVYAKKQGNTIFVECKFHNDQRRKSDVKVSLYVNSRFNDLKSKWKQNTEGQHNFEGWIVTNTRFTEDAIEYGSCAGLKMISWDYPSRGNLRQLVDSLGIHPITSMQSLTKNEKTFLMEKEIILCRQLVNQKNLLLEMGINENQISKIISEAYQISEEVQ